MQIRVVEAERQSRESEANVIAAAEPRPPHRTRQGAEGQSVTIPHLVQPLMMLIIREDSILLDRSPIIPLRLDLNPSLPWG